MKVLIVDDDPTTRLVLTSLVEKMGHQTQAFGDGQSAWEYYQNDPAPCLMLVDWEMPRLNGTKLCERIKERALLNPPYIILVTSRTSAEDIVEGLDRGADDYICKPYNGAELVARMEVARRTLELHQELHEMRQALDYQATHDELTGLLNRRAAVEALHSEFHRALRKASDLHLAICDIDHFKAVNDSYGHVVGDQVLQAVAERMQAVLRPYDLLARFGGEEFLIVIPEAIADARVIFERIRADVEAHQVPVNGGETVSVTLSIGAVSLKQAEAETTIEGLLIAADDRLYAAKHAGRNRVAMGEAVNG